MRTPRLLIGLMCVNVGLLAFLGMAPAKAHSGPQYYTHLWPANSSVNYWIDTDVPLGWRPRMKSAFSTWSNRANGVGPEFNFVDDADIQTASIFDFCEGVNAVFAVTNSQLQNEFGLAGPVNGVAKKCDNEDNPYLPRITAFSLYLATQPVNGTWYSGDSTPSSTQWDVWSTATHEVGHITGFYGHFTSTDPNCANSGGRLTMCDGDASDRGTTRLRYLEEHDLHTIHNGYN